MADILAWPDEILIPEECFINVVPFTRSGGRTLGGVEPATRTDLGYWSIGFSGIPVHTKAQRQTWNAIRQMLGGKAGLIAVPAWSFDTAPYALGRPEPVVTVPHDDDSLFDDDTPYQQGAISVVTSGVTPIGATTISVRIINAEPNLVGVRFSYEHALYETGPVISVNGDIWDLPIWPSVRALIPAGSTLEFDMPTCLCHLDDDRGMDGGVNGIPFERRTVSFVEATDYWAAVADT